MMGVTLRLRSAFQIELPIISIGLVNKRKAVLGELLPAIHNTSITLLAE